MNKFDCAVSPFALFAEMNSSGGPAFRGPVLKLNHVDGRGPNESPQGPVPIITGTKVVVNPVLLTVVWTKNT